MTLEERVIVETYTGYCMTSPEERDELYKYMAKIMGRPVYTHELADKDVQEELREKALTDFKTLCLTEEKWEKAVNKVSMLLPLYVSIGACGYFGAVYLEGLLTRYKKGERTLDLYESMIEAE